MKYFFDTEFIERFHKPFFGKPRHVIDLISIGIVAEDGRYYSAISNEYNYKDASDWVKENVIDLLYIYTVHGDQRNRYDSNNFQKAYGKSNKVIAEEIKEFILTPYVDYGNSNHEFYGYYADYDWVLLCSLFGTMMNLPKGFPMFCIDLKQMLDAKISTKEIRSIGYKAAVKRIKDNDSYPQQENEHNALADAKWNKKLFDFLNLI